MIGNISKPHLDFQITCSSPRISSHLHHVAVLKRHKDRHGRELNQGHYLYVGRWIPSLAHLASLRNKKNNVSFVVFQAMQGT